MEYKLRNLNCVGKTHYISGIFKDGNFESFGIQEWCWGIEDAKNILSLMMEDNRFSNLHIDEWKEE